MSQAKMQAARELIQEGKLEEARALLVSVDHPKARELIAKIDRRLAPPFSRSDPDATSGQPAPKRSGRPGWIRALAIVVLVGAGILIVWANTAGRQSFAPPSRFEQQVIDVVDRTLDSFEVSASDDAVTIRYQDRGPVKPAPGTQAAISLNTLLSGTICNLKQADVVGNRILYFDVSYGSDVVARISVNPDTMRAFDCSIARPNLEDAATLYQWSGD